MTIIEKKTLIGKRIPKLDARKKAVGEAVYVHDYGKQNTRILSDLECLHYPIIGFLGVLPVDLYPAAVS